MKKFIAIYCVCLSFVNFITAQKLCITPNNQTGDCIILQQCRSLYDLLSSSLSTEKRDFLRQSQCGIDGDIPLVCCPNKFTVDYVPPSCGISLLNAKAPVSDGDQTSSYDYPWMAMLHYMKPNGLGNFLCGGVLIHENYVITAAHCVFGSNLVKNQFTLDWVRFGENDLNANIDCDDDDVCADPVVDIQVAETIVHENYVPESISQANDIALIRLSRPVSFSDYIKPICLPIASDLRNEDYINVGMKVVGYGLDTNASETSTAQRQSSVDGISLDLCSTVYNISSLNSANKHICVQNKQLSNSCIGDSGGPLTSWNVIFNSRFRYPFPYTYLAGIHSFGSNICSSSDHPVVFTRVDQYIDWILDHMKS